MQALRDRLLEVDMPLAMRPWARTPAGLAEIELPPLDLKAWLGVPPGAGGVIVFVHDSGESRESDLPLAAAMRQLGFATLLLELLLPHEAADRSKALDVALMAERLQDSARWLLDQEVPWARRLGLYGTGLGAAAAWLAAAAPGNRFAAVVTGDGRPELADSAFDHIVAPTLLMAFERDEMVLALNRMAFDTLRCHKELVILRGATARLEGRSARADVVVHSARWFETFLSPERSLPRR